MFQGMLTHWTKKIIVEDGHSVAQLVHILQLVVRHFKVYYPVRHHLIQHMVNSLQRLGFTQSVCTYILQSNHLYFTVVGLKVARNIVLHVLYPQSQNLGRGEEVYTCYVALNTPESQICIFY